MTSKIGRTRNFNDTANVSSAVSLNSSTSTTVASANSARIFLSVSNPSSKEVWLKLQAASADNTQKGIQLPPRSYWEMPTDNIYAGEVSAISSSGTPDIYYTEY